jgi:hypothetical protein
VADKNPIYKNVLICEVLRRNPLARPTHHIPVFLDEFGPLRDFFNKFLIAKKNWYTFIPPAIGPQSFLKNRQKK